MRSPSPPTARVVQVIEALCADEHPLTLADIVRRTGHSRATAHAVVTELCNREWVMRLPDGTYTTGSRLIGLAAGITRADHLTRRARPTLDALAGELGVDCFVARRVGDEIVIVDHRPRPDHTGADGTAAGSALPLRPPVCREFIAWEPAEVRAEWIAQAPVALRTRLGLALDAVRERGASIERMTDDHVAVLTALNSLERTAVPQGVRSQVGELLGHLTAIDYLPAELAAAAGERVAVVTVGAPVLDASGSVVASVVSCPNRSIAVPELDRIVAATRAAAEQLGAAPGTQRASASRNG
ncbi:helix-turn-helix domain-containing protein [Gordonia sp. DT219]|uniref:helix-turn-helix domain-containing protein n=1 Tax=Gordonia sp. DT219 TaxID=3416658 RepID=UPI003CF616E7